MAWRVNFDEFFIAADNARMDKNKSTADFGLMSRKSLFSVKENEETLSVPFKDGKLDGGQKDYSNEDAPSTLRQSEFSLMWYQGVPFISDHKQGARIPKPVVVGACCELRRSKPAENPERSGAFADFYPER